MISEKKKQNSTEMSLAHTEVDKYQFWHRVQTNSV